MSICFIGVPVIDNNHIRLQRTCHCRVCRIRITKQGRISRFSMVTQIRWKFNFALIQIARKWSLWNFARGTTTVLSRNAQNFETICPTMELHLNQFPLNLNYDGKSFVKWAPGLMNAGQSYRKIRYALVGNMYFRFWYLTLIPAWISNHLRSKMWDEIIFQFLIF